MSRSNITVRFSVMLKKTQCGGKAYIGTNRRKVRRMRRPVRKALRVFGMFLTENWWAVCNRKV